MCRGRSLLKPVKVLKIPPDILKCIFHSMILYSVFGIILYFSLQQNGSLVIIWTDLNGSPLNKFYFVVLWHIEKQYQSTKPIFITKAIREDVNMLVWMYYSATSWFSNVLLTYCRRFNSVLSCLESSCFHNAENLCHLSRIWCHYSTSTFLYLFIFYYSTRDNKPILSIPHT